MAESPMAVGASMAPHHHASVYAQRALPVALFHTPAPRSDRANLRRSASCLRKISAYNGGFRVADDEEEAAGGVHEARAARFAKKRLSFADQHGGQLVLEKEFHARDAPIYCNKAITYSLPLLHSGQEDPSGWRAGSRSVVERLLRGTLRSGGRGGDEQKSGWTQPELLSLCVLSCSVVGCVVLGYARTIQSK